MNPISGTRYALVRYALLWTLLAAAWAVAFALPAGLAAWVAAVGGAVWGFAGGFAGILLWNVLRYGAEEIRIPFLRAAMRLVVGALFTLVVAGAETAAVALVSEGLPGGFAATIPARCLTTAGVYVCFALWYLSVGAADDARDEGRHSPPSVARDENTVGTSTAGSEAGAAGIPGDGTGRDDAPATLDRVTVRGAGGRIEVITLDDIVCLQAEGDYVAIVTARGRHLKEGTMKWFEEALPRDRFVRVHRSCIVAVDRISRIETSGRDHTLTLRDGRGSIRISDTGYRLLRRRLGL